MGVFKKGILGGFSGKIGTVIGSTWRTLDVMKSLPKKSTKPAVQAQIDQRFIFSMVVAFMAKLEKVISIGFRNITGVQTAMNTAVSLTIDNAVTGVSPAFTIDYSKVVLSKGNLEPSYDAKIVASAGRKLNLTWSPAEGDPLKEDVKLRNSDMVVLVIYNPAKNIVRRIDTATRGLATLEVNMAFVFDGANYAWVFFAEVKGKKVSDSQYLGQIQVADVI
jgi:hypothetical protein